MKNILIKTHVLEYDKSSFNVKLKIHETKKLYVEISQTIKNADFQMRKVLFNPTLLPDLIRVLKEFQEEIDNSKLLSTIVVPLQNQEKMQNRYLKGVPIKDLALQFGLKEAQVQSILENKGLYIVSTKEQKPPRFFKKSKK